VGGESEPARRLVAEQGDVWFINGRPLHELLPMLADLRARPRADLPPLRFGLSAFVIARATASEAHEHYRHLLQLAELDASRPRRRPRNTDDQVVMHKRLEQLRSIGTNGGSLAGLIGSYDEVAHRMRAFHAAGVDTFLLMFQPFEADMRSFAQHVMPQLRA
jgi:alkanesulfonate monooxygenase